MRKTVSWSLLTALLVGIGACGGAEKENCTNGVDDDADGFVDCNDGSCAGAPSCATIACGDGVRAEGEDCDGADLGGQTCDELGLGSGPLSCKADCSFNTTNCEKQACGDGHIDPGEPCDGFELGGKTCESLGFEGGALSCRPDCSIDTSECGGPEQCNDGVDNDKDLVFDCSDPDCQTNAICSTGGETICDDLIDDDQDGLIDCQDPDDCQKLAICVSGSTPIGGACLSPKDCASHGGDPVCLHDHDYEFPGGFCSEFCSMGADDCGADATCVGPLPNSKSGLCVPKCTMDANCRAGYECVPVANDMNGPVLGCMPTQENCTGGIDDDGDGQIDCADPGCDFFPACAENCSNGIDDDGDGKTDCKDKGCRTSSACVEACNNDVDDDGDGQIDCKDAQCKYTVSCAEDCGNNIDDNGNGSVDCDDPVCAADSRCVEDCFNGIDDDGDGLADCDDPACKWACPDPEICTGGVDDDLDGYIDCEDIDCQVSEPKCDPTVACNAAPVLQNGVTIQGTTIGGTSQSRGWCALDGGAPERIYRFEAGMPGEVGELLINYDAQGQELIVYVRQACSEPGSEVICASGGSGFGIPITGGTYYVIVDGAHPMAQGPFSLSASFTPAVCGDGVVALPEQCDPPDGTTCDANCQIILGPEAICDDLKDNDQDNVPDCLDSTCQGTPACVPGNAPLGSLCSAHTDCQATGGDPICLWTWPDGYCSEGCDMMQNDCPIGSACLPVSADKGLCIGTCFTSADCRPGFMCLEWEPGVSICYPG